MWELDHKKGWAPMNWCLWIVVLEKTVESSMVSRKSNQLTLKEINPEYSLERLMLKLKLQYFDHLMWRTDSLEKTMMLGKTESWRRGGPQRTKWLDGITHSVDISLHKLWEIEGQGSMVCYSPWGHKESDMTSQLNNNNLQFQGPLVPISLRSILGIVIVRVLGTVWWSCN